MVQILPTLATAPRLVYYENCKANLYAALRRQWTAAPQPNDAFLDKFETYFRDVILVEIRELLHDFHYSYDVWYNHLTKQQQDAMDKLKPEDLHIRYVKIFCKCEKQLIENGEMPKNRAISALCEESKFVMGPVVYALEQYFKNFKGYGGGKNWTETADMFNMWRSKGWTKTSQSDISGMDRSVVQRLKRIIGHEIYRLVEPFITHVPLDVYQIHAYPVLTKIIAEYYVDKNMYTLGSSLMEGEVFSGSSDTTFFNTVVTAVMQRFVFEVVLAIPKDEYDLTAKGDDSANAMSPSVSNQDIRNAFNQVYYQAKDVKGAYTTYMPKHGCGMVLKFLSISEHLDDIDYCSTNCYYCEECGYRLTRKIDRFIYLTPWSDSIVNLTDNERQAYMQSLYKSNLKWMDGLPIFSTLNNLLQTGVSSNAIKPGQMKKTRILSPTDQKWYETMFNVSREKRRAKLQQKFGKNAAYSILDQVSKTKPCCVKAYKLWLFNKCGLTESDILDVENDITLSSGDTYFSATLTKALEAYEEYKSTLLLD